jgi:hypothetical protein
LPAMAAIHVDLAHVAVGCNRVVHALHWGDSGLLAYGGHNAVVVYDPEVIPRDETVCTGCIPAPVPLPLQVAASVACRFSLCCHPPFSVAGGEGAGHTPWPHRRGHLCAVAASCGLWGGGAASRAGLWLWRLHRARMGLDAAHAAPALAPGGHAAGSLRPHHLPHHARPARRRPAAGQHRRRWRRGGVGVLSGRHGRRRTSGRRRCAAVVAPAPAHLPGAPDTALRRAVGAAGRAGLAAAGAGGCGRRCAPLLRPPGGPV